MAEYLEPNAGDHEFRINLMEKIDFIVNGETNTDLLTPKTSCTFHRDEKTKKHKMDYVVPVALDKGMSPTHTTQTLYLDDYDEVSQRCRLGSEALHHVAWLLLTAVFVHPSGSRCFPRGVWCYSRHWVVFVCDSTPRTRQIRLLLLEPHPPMPPWSNTRGRNLRLNISVAMRVYGVVIIAAPKK